MLPLYNTKIGAFREIISRGKSDGRRDIELNSGSLPPIPGGLATLDVAGNSLSLSQEVGYDACCSRTRDRYGNRGKTRSV